jgi:hypothetical protein
MGRKTIADKGRMGETLTKFKDKNGYWRINVTDSAGHSVWPYEHRYLWEKKNGPIPNGASVRFRDKDRDNLDIDNLYLAGEDESEFSEKITKTAQLQIDLDSSDYKCNELNAENEKLKNEVIQLKDKIIELEKMHNELMDMLEKKE